jgi:hypothetical protein
MKMTTETILPFTRNCWFFNGTNFIVIFIFSDILNHKVTTALYWHTTSYLEIGNCSFERKSIICISWKNGLLDVVPSAFNVLMTS